MIFTFAVAGCGEKQAAPQTSESARQRVMVVKPQRKTIRRVSILPGQIDAFDVAQLHAKLAAYVEKYHADIGDRVTGPRVDEAGHAARGQVLAELTAPELDRELEQKRALVAQAGADVEQAQAAVKVAQANALAAEAQMREAVASRQRFEAEYERWSSEYDRVVKLVSRSAVTQKLADETKAQMLAAEASRREADAKIEAARAAAASSSAQVEKAIADEAAIRARRQVAEAEERRTAALVDYLRIEAPFDGVVSARNADIGDFADGSGSALPLFTVVRVDPVRVFVDLPEMDAPLADVGDRAVVRVQSLPGRDFTGAVSRTSWALDSATRTLHTEVDVPNADGALRPGMYAQVRIDLAERQDAWVVPAAALFNQGDRTWCVVVEDGRAQRKQVIAGLKSEGEVEIRSGLDGDELIVRDQGASIASGQELEIAPSTPAR